VAAVNYLVASTLGIGVAAVLNFAIQDRLTFRTARRG
jgi:putative flippase GtrA